MTLLLVGFFSDNIRGLRKKETHEWFLSHSEFSRHSEIWIALKYEVLKKIQGTKSSDTKLKL